MREQATSSAEIEAQRARSLVERKIAAQANLDEADALVEVSVRELSMSEMRKRIAAMELKRAEEVLRQRSIISPIDGVVVARLLYVGEFADQDRPVVRIEANLPVIAYTGLQVGMGATISPGSPAGGEYQTVVTVVDKVFDAASNTFGIRAAMVNPDLKIPAGNRCLIELDISGAGD